MRGIFIDGLYRVGATDDNPCDLFERIEFPMDEFYPPERCEFLEDGKKDPSVECGCDRD